MNKQAKTTFFIVMTIALACGFMHHLVPVDTLNFERLHIFLFNLCSGGTLILYFTEGKAKFSLKVKLFFLLSMLFAICSFLEWYLPTIFIPVILAGIVEAIRVDHFGSIFPTSIFSSKERNARKFHQASLLCLSIGLLISSPVIINDVYLQAVEIEKLKLDTFFLGFSFPVSLISMSVIFSLMKKAEGNRKLFLKDFSFWIINLGVIIFFLFILANLFIPQVIISTILFLAVSNVLYLYYHDGIQLQQKAFLTSGILFLLITSITGIIYILLAFSPSYDPENSKVLLRLHAFTALYGWNLSGLAVITRHGDFPLKLHSQKIIILHWLTVIVLCPLGYFFPLFAIAATICYLSLLYNLFFNEGTVDTELIQLENEVLNN